MLGGVEGGRVQDSSIFSFNPFPNKPWFLRVCGTRLLKTLWEKEKLLKTLIENFLSFPSNLKLSSANSFSLEETKIYLFGKGLITMFSEVLFLKVVKSKNHVVKS